VVATTTDFFIAERPPLFDPAAIFATTAATDHEGAEHPIFATSVTPEKTAAFQQLRAAYVEEQSRVTELQEQLEQVAATLQLRDEDVKKLQQEQQASATRWQQEVTELQARVATQQQALTEIRADYELRLRNMEYQNQEEVKHWQDRVHALESEQAALPELRGELSRERLLQTEQAEALAQELQRRADHETTITTQQRLIDELTRDLQQQQQQLSELQEQFSQRSEQLEATEAELRTKEAAHQLLLEQMQAEFEAAIQRQQDAEDELRRLREHQTAPLAAASTSAESGWRESLPAADVLQSLTKERVQQDLPPRQLPKRRKVKAVKPDGSIEREPFHGPSYKMVTDERPPSTNAAAAVAKPPLGGMGLPGMAMGELRSALRGRGGPPRGRGLISTNSAPVISVPQASPAASPIKRAPGPGAAVKEWINKILIDYPGVSISDWSKSFSSGLVLCAILHHYQPQLINGGDFAGPQQKTPLERTQIALEAANRLGVNQLIEAEDMTDPHFPPEPKSVMLYCSTLQHKLASLGFV
jgi:hypothetical protein